MWINTSRIFRTFIENHKCQKLFLNLKPKNVDIFYWQKSNNQLNPYSCFQTAYLKIFVLVKILTIVK